MSGAEDLLVGHVKAFRVLFSGFWRHVSKRPRQAVDKSGRVTQSLAALISSTSILTLRNISKHFFMLFKTNARL